MLRYPERTYRYNQAGWRSPIARIALLAAVSSLVLAIRPSLPRTTRQPPATATPEASVLPAAPAYRLCPGNQLPTGNIYQPTTQEGADDTYKFSPRDPVCSVPVHDIQHPENIRTYLNPGMLFSTLCSAPIPGSPRRWLLITVGSEEAAGPTGYIELSPPAVSTFQTDASLGTLCADTQASSPTATPHAHWRQMSK